MEKEIIYIDIYIYIYIYIHIHTHIHTYIHIYMRYKMNELEEKKEKTTVQKQKTHYVTSICQTKTILIYSL